MPGTSLGNVKSFVYSSAVTVKDHFSKQSPVRAIDFSVISELGATIKMELEEINEFNLGLYLLAESGSSHLTGLTAPQLEGTLTFTGTNSIGAQVTFTGLVQLQPGGDYNVLSDNDDFSALPISAKVLFSAGGYGHWTTNGVSSPNVNNYSISQGTVTFEAGTA
jgi:hypothetical protein